MPFTDMTTLLGRSGDSRFGEPSPALPQSPVLRCMLPFWIAYKISNKMVVTTLSYSKN